MDSGLELHGLFLYMGGFGLGLVLYGLRIGIRILVEVLVCWRLYDS